MMGTLIMNISRPHLEEITEVIEDTIEYACDKYGQSGELMWTVVLTLSQVKLAEFGGNIKRMCD